MRCTLHYDMPPLPTTAKAMQCEKSCTKLEWLNCDRRMRHCFHGKLVVHVDLMHAAKSSEIWFIILNCQLLSNGTRVERYQNCLATHSFLGNSSTSAMFTTGNTSWCRRFARAMAWNRHYNGFPMCLSDWSVCLLSRNSFLWISYVNSC